jgi:opacity protein-like surface antigen
MRIFVGGVIALALVGSAAAGEYGDEPLRGSYNWAGYYAGAHGGFTNVDFGLSRAAKDLVANMVRATLVESEANVSDLPRLGRGHDANGSFGGFVGYNSQWENVVVGVEIGYTRSSIAAASADSISRSFVTSDEFRNDIDVNANATAKLTDLATLRLRGGYAMDWLLPYAFVGAAAGRFNYSRHADVVISQTDVSASALDPTDGIPPRAGGFLADSRTQTKNGAFTYGVTAGLGVDVGLLPGVFVRGEWEVVQFGTVGGIQMTVNTFRVGAALKY